MDAVLPRSCIWTVSELYLIRLEHCIEVVTVVWAQHAHSHALLHCHLWSTMWELCCFRLVPVAVAVCLLEHVWALHRPAAEPCCHGQPQIQTAELQERPPLVQELHTGPWCTLSCGQWAASWVQAVAKGSSFERSQLFFFFFFLSVSHLLQACSAACLCPRWLRPPPFPVSSTFYALLYVRKGKAHMLKNSLNIWCIVLCGAGAVFRAGTVLVSLFCTQTLMCTVAVYF